MPNLGEGVSAANGRRRTMSSVTAALVALAIIGPCLAAGLFSPAAAKVLAFGAVMGTSLWVAVDSSRLKVREYKSQVAAHPFVLFTASLGLWIVVFPVYLVVRSRIQQGLLLKEVNPRQRYALYVCIAMWLVPPVMMFLAYLMARSLN